CSDGWQFIPASTFHEPPNPGSDALESRLVGDYMLYVLVLGGGSAQKEIAYDLYGVGWTEAGLHQVILSDGIDPIEQMGDAAVVVGTDGADLHFSAITLSDSPDETFDYVRKGASQGELRSHGFLYKPENEDTGMLGLAISVP